MRALCQAAGITDVICAKKRPRGQANHTKLPTPLGMRWTVERTNSWLSNYGQLRRNTDRPHPTPTTITDELLAQISLAIAHTGAGAASSTDHHRQTLIMEWLFPLGASAGKSPQHNVLR